MSTKSIVCVGLLAAFATPVCADSPGLLKIFQRNPAPDVADTARMLAEEDGPWLILAHTFVGEGSKARAERLAEEIRSELKLPAFIYQESFDFTGDLNRSRGYRIRYANQYEYEGHAVLVGEYDSVNHPSVSKDLERIKTANPAVFRDPNEIDAETTLTKPVTVIKAIHRKLMANQPDKTRGPMFGAFVTRNPKLSPEYFEAPQVDSFIHKLNEGRDHSLLDCDGKYTVVVRTFEGLGTIVDGKNSNKFEPSMERLDKFAADAGRMVNALRKDGVEAYQYHDRNRSVVTVGSFEVLGRELPGGEFEYAPEIRAVVKKYAAFNVRPEIARQAPNGKGGANNAAMIPFDVEPTPIAVPKASKRSLYTAAMRMR